MHFALGHGEQRMGAIRRTYACMNYDDGKYLSQRHLDLLGRAWLAVGPHVQEPPLHRVPCVMDVLGRFEREDSLLEGWLLSLVGDTLRRHSWTETSEDLCALYRMLDDKRIRGYWEWLIESIKSHCTRSTCVNSDWQRHIVASRVVITLYARCHLTSLARRVDAWEAWQSLDQTDFEKTAPGHVQRLVPGVGSRDPGLVFRDMWERCAYRWP